MYPFADKFDLSPCLKENEEGENKDKMFKWSCLITSRKSLFPKLQILPQTQTSQYSNYKHLVTKPEQYKKTVTQKCVSANKITHKIVYTTRKERKLNTSLNMFFTNKLTHQKVRTMQSKWQGSTCPGKCYKPFSSFSRQKLTVLLLRGAKTSSLWQVSLAESLLSFLFLGRSCLCKGFKPFTWFSCQKL